MNNPPDDTNPEPPKPTDKIVDLEVTPIRFNDYFVVEAGNTEKQYVTIYSKPEGVEDVIFGSNNGQVGPYDDYVEIIAVIAEDGWKIMNPPDKVRLVVEIDTNEGPSGQ